MSVTASCVTGRPSRNLPIRDLGGMRKGCKPRQSEKAASALDGVNETKNVGENFGVVRLLLEPHEFDVDRIETLVGLGQEIAQQLVHGQRPFAPGEPQRRTDSTMVVCW